MTRLRATADVRDHDDYECNDPDCWICIERGDTDGCADCGCRECRCPEDGPDQDGGSDV